MSQLYSEIVAIETYLQSIVLLLVRLYWGWQLATIGSKKFAKFGQTSKYFSSLGIVIAPVWVLLVALTELLGGISLFFGLGVHIMMIPLVISLISALIAGHREGANQIFKDPMKFVTQPPLTFLLVVLFVLVFGAGILSLDHLLHW